jgi:hypothetical protein
MDNNNRLTRFNTGNSHQNNPLGGIPIGSNNSVEENETKQNNFVYSNRIFLDKNVVSQYNLPKSLIGKSVADATKFIDNKFKGRNDKISQSTKNGMLSKIAEAQESMKPQEPEMGQSQESVDQSQMSWGGFSNSTIGQGFEEDSTDEQKTNALNSGLSTVGTVMDLGKTAFGRSSQDTSGTNPSTQVNTTNMIGTSALKGASAGMAFGPAGAGIGAIVGAGVGLLGAKKAEKNQKLNDYRYTLGNFNKSYGEQYAYGGEIDPPATLPLRSADLENSMERYKLLRASAVRGSNVKTDYKPDLRSPEQAMMDYQYLRDSAKPNFKVNSGYKPNLTDPETAQILYNKLRNNKFAMGGKLNQMSDGGDYYENLKLNARNQDPNSLGLQNFLKPIGTTVPYTIETQPRIDVSNANRIITSGPSTFDILKYNANKIGNVINNNAGNIARYAPIAANAYQLSQLKKPQEEKLKRLDNRYAPSYVDLAQQQNIVNQELNNTNSAIQESGASQGASRNAILGSQLNKTKALSNAYMNAEAQNRQQDDRAQTFNLGVDQTNLQQSNSELDINDRNSAAYRNEKSKYISAIGNDIGEVGKEQVQKKMISTATGYTYDGKYVKSPDGNIVVDPDTGEAMTGEKMKTLQASKNVKKQALGGYLIKNKIK